MTDPTTDLMTHVERIVRPARADWSKNRFRRELLAHLHAAYDEERARGLDHPAALAAAKQRLGDPATLTAQLESSISPFERFAVSRLPGSRLLDRVLPSLVPYGPATTPFRWPILLTAAAVLPTLAISLPTLPSPIAGPRLPLAAGFLAIECWVAFLYLLLIDLIFSIPPRWRRIAICVPAFVLAGLSWYYPLTFAFTGQPSATPVLDAVQCQLGALALMTLPSLVTATLLRRPLRPWLSIDLAQ